LIARAPGKIVISGAHAVLEGAPAIVAAVDRYAVADARRPAAFITPEVAAALGSRPAPWIDASALRQEDRKLGLGSSAAILVASLAALALVEEGPLDDATLAARVFPAALAAHARAQGGGSGIDVAASCFGGIRIAVRREDGLETTPARLPTGLVLEIWSAKEPASTAALLAAVRDLGRRDPERHRSILGAQAQASLVAAEATRRDDGGALIAALREQRVHLDRLGRAAGVRLVTAAVAELDSAARAEQAVVLPAGAGGGDVAVFVGIADPSEALRALVARTGHVRLEASLAARGVHAMA
jgi:phosphomevalonate kinase